MKPPGPRGLDNLRYLRRLQGPQILDAVQDLWKSYGDTSVISLPFGRSIYFIHDPADVMEILVRQAKKFIKGKALETFKLLIGNGVAVSDKDIWVRQRRQVQPNFHHQSLGRYAPIIVQTAAEYRAVWLQHDGFQNFDRLLPQLTQAIIARTLLGADLSRQLSDLQSNWDEAMAFVVQRTNAMVRWPLMWPLPSHRRFARARRLIRGSVARLIEEQGDGGHSPDPNTLMNRMLRSHSTEISQDELATQVLNVLFAGHETTGNGLSSALLFTLTHPEIHARIMSELEDVLAGEAPDYARLEKQVYLRQVVYETLRLRSPVALFLREAREDIQLSACTLPQGAIVMLSPHILHRHPALWSDPDTFDPGRFNDPSACAPPKFLAFGAGGRTCVGDQYAIDTMMLVLSGILQNLNLELDRSRPIQILCSNGTFKPHPLNIRVTASSSRQSVDAH